MSLRSLDESGPTEQTKRPYKSMVFFDTHFGGSNPYSDLTESVYMI
jgi:hypothetical protein